MSEEAIAPTGVEESETSVEELESIGTPAPEPETEESTSEEEEALETVEEEEQEAEEEEQEHEEIEFDLGGNKLKFKEDAPAKEVAEEMGKFSKRIWSDYTRKSQEVAETRKSLETREAEVQKLETMNDDMLGSYSQGLRLQSQLDELEQINLDQLKQSDPDQALQVYEAISKAKLQLSAVKGDVDRKQRALSESQQKETVRRFDEGKAKIERRIKGFSSKAPEVIDYIHKRYGYEKASMEKTWALNPDSAEMAYKAMLFDKMQSKVSKRAKPKPATAKAVQPMKAKGSRAGKDLVKDADKMSTEEWAKQRQADIEKKRKSGVIVR